MAAKIKLVTASAGSGKTYKLQQTLAEYVNPANPNKIRPEGVIATTFTKKSALELKERAREILIEKKYYDEATRLEGALISTVDSVCTKIIEMFCYEAGLSPKIDVIPPEDSAIYFNTSLASVLDSDVTSHLQKLVDRLLDYDSTRDFDWRSTVSAIVAEARTNAINSTGLDKSFQYSWEKMKDCLPEVMKDSKAYEKQIISEGKDILVKLETLPEMSGKDEKFHKKLTQVVYYLEKGWDLLWDDWLALTGELNADGKDIATSFQGLVSDHIAHEKFQDDYKSYLKEIFSISAKSIEAYQSFKKARGLLDFVDMECMVSDLLNKEDVQKRISDSFDLLMVDEFQDTSPLQLNIFLKLSKIIKHVIWVGDQKQSIYGFRGADPSLMKSLLDKLGNQVDVETLGNSYRSRPDLVEHSNALFTKAFDGLLAPEQIQLNAVRTDLSGHTTALEVWRIQKRGQRHSIERNLRGVAKKIKSLLEEKRQVAFKKNKNEEILSDISYKDIAVLLHANDDCAQMAEYLIEEGIPVSIEQEGFLELPESKLVMAALRYFAFPQDTLSAFELKFLAEGKNNVEEMIAERVVSISQQQHESYGKDYWIHQRLDEMRINALHWSPLEVVNNIIVKLDLQRVVSSWEGTSNRTNNLALFRQCAKTFEEHCLRQKVGATLGGFILWLKQVDKEGLIGYGANEDDAVSVMTWHKSKGLEWPMVILLDCHREPKTSPFGIKVISNNPDIDLNDPLKDRLIRFWFNYKLPSRSESRFETLVTQSTIGKKHAENCIEESKRLLYVGFTRARDYLCIPLDSKSSAELIKQCLGEDAVDLPTNEGEVLLSWAPSCSAVKVVHFFEEFTNTNLNNHVMKEVLSAFSGPQPYENYLINPSRVEELESAQASLMGQYGKRLTVKVKVDDDKLGDCLHDIAALSKITQEEILRVLKNYNLENVLVPDEILKQLELYDAFLIKNGIKIIHSELPVMARMNGKFLNGVIDQLGSEGDELCIIDHKSYQGTDLEKKSTSFSGQLDIYRKVLELSGKKVKRMLIHFITLGVVYEVKV
jgi:ATP-dependent exoDNAse (exonuclease V) beta subunit